MNHTSLGIVTLLTSWPYSGAATTLLPPAQDKYFELAGMDELNFFAYQERNGAMPQIVDFATRYLCEKRLMH